MTSEPGTVTPLPPPPPGNGSDLYDPWMCSAADLLAAANEHGHREQPLVPTGRDDLNQLEPGTLNVLVAPSGDTDAATAAVTAVAHHAAYYHDLPTLLYPLRSTLPQIAEHLAWAHRNAEPGTGVDDRTGVDLRDCPLYISVGSPITVTRVHFDAVNPDMAAPRLIVVDAVDLLLPAGAARDLKHLALELNVAVVCTTTVTAADIPVSVTAASDTIVALLDTPPRGDGAGVGHPGGV